MISRWSRSEHRTTAQARATAANHIVTVDNGKPYVADKSFHPRKLKAGKKISVAFTVKNGTNEASAVKAM